MRGKRAVTGAEHPEAPVEQGEMDRFVGADREPVVDELGRETGAEAAGEVEGEIDRAELDMRQRVKHRDPPAIRAAAPASAFATAAAARALADAPASRALRRRTHAPAPPCARRARRRAPGAPCR